MRDRTHLHCCPMGPDEQNLHFHELRQKVCLYIHNFVLLRGLPRLEGKHKLFVRKELKTVSQAKLGKLASDRLYTVQLAKIMNVI